MSIGQKAMVPFAVSIVFEVMCHSQPVNSFTVTATQIRMKQMKNCTVRLITHCMVTEIGSVYCGSCGFWMAKTDQIAAKMPR